MPGVSLALTGHRPSKLDGYDLDTPFYRRLKAALTEIVYARLDRAMDWRQTPDADGFVALPPIAFHCGMALGADTIWAEVACTFKRYFPMATLTAHIPFPGQPDRWPPEAKARYRRLLAQADKQVVCGEIYTPPVMHARNHGLMSAADTLIAVWDGSEHSGTGMTVRMARQAGKDVVVPSPDMIRAQLPLAAAK